MKTLPLHLDPGTDIKHELTELARANKLSGYILGVVGNVSKASFQCPGKEGPNTLEGNLEIISLNGTISPSGVHLHLSISDGSCSVFGGHLEDETIVLKGVDILICSLDDEVTKLENNKEKKDSEFPRVEIFVLNDCPWC